MKRNVLFGIFLLILGSFLEVFYYVQKYNSDGDHILLSISKGIALTLLTMAFALLIARYKKNAWFYIGIVLSIAYSIFCTSSGQATSYASKYNKEKSVVMMSQRKSEEMEFRKESLLRDIEDLREKKKTKEDQRDSIPLQERKVWRFVGRDSEGDANYESAESEVFKTLNNEIESYENQIKEKELLYENLNPEIIVSEKETDSYQILSDMTGLNVVLIQYILQSMFSLFAAVMAPVGLKLCQKEDIAVIEKKIEQRLPEIKASTPKEYPGMPKPAVKEDPLRRRHHPKQPELFQGNGIA
jgi:hypothetical protein